MNKAIKIDPIDMSAYSSSSNKHPVAILNEYAAKHHLVPHYTLIHNGSSLSIVSFKYTVNLDKFVAEGEAISKKQAKLLAASNLLKKIINDKPQLLNTDFNECAISPYDNNIKQNAFFTKMNRAIEVDQQDMSAYLSSSNKHPVAILNEYAAKNHLVPHYTLIHNGSSLSIVSFKYTVNLDKFVAEGEAISKKQAKLLAASNLLKKIINDKPQVLNTDFNECAIPQYDKNIKLNYIGKLFDMCLHKNIKLPEYNLVKEEGQDHNKLFTISCHAGQMIETATCKTKKQAKYLAAFQMVNSLMSCDIVVEKCQNVSGSIQAQGKLNTKSWLMKKSITKHSTCEDYHLVLKKTEWKKSDTLNMVVNQYLKNGGLDLPDPYNIFKKIITESKNMHFIFKTEKIKSNFNNYYWCTYALTDVYPHVYGCGVDTNSEMAQDIALKELLIGICILLK
ncbi:uncharacterized protein LOC132936652 [Metopolophium dirhodum]|uniref:uncharacterized protein LOC132936652 n=1 Tax=Metopolophium dirhodum TaxID=44670 RepID=UPI00298FF03B|nr:uncharacterized protein LOC132936652 [Metopolophium dirhodum]